MIPLKIKMLNFLSYEDTEFDFSKITNATVVGENGAGKSSFCTDSIVWAIYGIASKGGVTELDNYVHEGADSCTVEFTFDLNGNVYKIIRSHSKAKNKNSLTLFTINDDGDEIPLSTGKLTETQYTIEHLIKMNYRTFISSSMVFQNKSNEFTENMSDTERKEALISILDIDEWDNLSKLANNDSSSLKSEVELAENNISHYKDIVDKETEYKEQKKIVVHDLEAINVEKNKQQKIVDANQQKIYELDTLEKDITVKNQDLINMKQKIEDNNASINTLQSEIQQSNTNIENYNKSIDNAQKLIDNADKINQAVVDEQNKILEIQQYEQQRVTILQKQNELATVVQKGKDWNANHQNQLIMVQNNIKHAESQAQALQQVPCATTVSFSNSCPFLRMANEAKQSLTALYTQLQDLNNQKNPHRDEWSSINHEYIAIKDNFQENILLEKKNSLLEIQKYSHFKANLDVAVSKINSTMTFIDETKKIIENKKGNIDSLVAENKKISSDIQLKTDELTKLTSSTNTFVDIKRDFMLAKDEITRLTNQENSLIESVGKYNNLFAQIEEAKKKIKETKKMILSKKEELRTINIFQDACSKKSGVPSFIVENAVPELASIANKVLDNMLDGRLQLRFDTQMETKTTKNLKEVLKIIVMDNGYARKYETYSGAEKFVIDLAIRIAMSKFLAHRAGTSIQLFVLDEGVSCADNNNREEIISAIKSISKEFEKVLFITHLEELKDSLDQKILVTKDSKGSHIKVLE